MKRPGDNQHASGDTSSPSLTYTSYLRVDELLSIQTPRSQEPYGPEHDELLFIVIHQVYELWFKQLLHELDYLQARLRANETARATPTLRRILAILKTIVAQVDVLETMTPDDRRLLPTTAACWDGHRAAISRAMPSCRQCQTAEHGSYGTHRS